MFELNDQHKMIQDMMRQYCDNEIQPKVDKLEDGEIMVFDMLKHMAQTFNIPEMIKGRTMKLIERRRKLEQEGGSDSGSRKELLGGGAEIDPFLMLLFIKELTRVSPSFALSLAAHLGLCGQTILSKGTSDQLEKYALPLISFEKFGCWGLTEPDAGSDAFALKTTAKPDGDYYVLNGSKTFITNAPYADIFVIVAKIDRGEGTKADKRLVYPFVMEKGTPGLSVSKPMKKMGMKGSPTGEIFLSDVRLHKDQLLGKKEKAGRDQAKETLSGEREGSPAMAWGIIERCLEDCVKYSIERKQFGKPIAEFQLMQEKIAKMYVALENVKNHAFKQAWAMKEGKTSLKDACAAKYYCATAAVEVGLEAIQLMGGYGYVREYHVEMLMRDAKLIGIGGGTNEIQLLNIAKEIFKEKDFNISIY
jgi:alkylation response protein AidB-like acyl-CoA dehydrogenase